MRILIFSVCIFFLGFAELSGQGTYVPPDIPTKAVKALDDAVLASAIGKIDGPVQTIKQLITKYPSWISPREELSRIFYKAGMKKEAIETLEASLPIDTNSQVQNLYTLGRMYEENGEPEKAMDAYRAVIRLCPAQPDLAKKAKSSLTSLEAQIDLYQPEEDITFIPLPSEINTPTHEYLGRWTLDGKKLIFTRRINHQDDLFIATFDSNQNVTIEDVSINSSFDEAAHTISPDGKYLVFTACDRPDGMGSCDLYLSVKKNEFWTKPMNMGPLFNGPSWESQPCFGLDGKTIFFASNRSGGFGGRDIWLVRQLPDGKWSAPINAGNQINTANNDESPFIHFDGRTIYFMRDGKDGLGGYDLYFSHMGLNGQWQTPANMKAPINSAADEGALSLHPDGKTALFTRTTSDQLNDLFQFRLPERFLSAPMQALEVKVIDKESKKPLHARIEVFEYNGLDTIRTSQWSDASGYISMALEKNKNYGLISSAEGYSMYSLNLPADTNSVRKKTIELIAMTSAVDQPIVLQNVFFSTGSAMLLPSSNAELNLLYKTLLDHPTMKIEIRGHTDNVGEEEYNQQLSEARAKSVFQFLVDHGIVAERLSYTGFGETKPVASNDSEEGRKQNRRTEFVIVSCQ